MGESVKETGIMEKINLSEMYIDDEIRKKVIDVLDSGRYIKGEENKKFEEEFARFVGAKHAVSVNSGTAALYLAMLAANLRKGAEVVMPSHTFIATASPAIELGAAPAFADIDGESYTMDPAEAVKKVSKNTAGFVPVHLYGHPVDMDPLVEEARKKGLFIIEDCCQAHGALYKGKGVGSIGTAGCFSFFPSKNMTVAGDGGMLVTNDSEIAEKAAMLRDQGRKKTEKYVHDLLGYNFRLSEIHAAIGRLQLRHLPEWLEKRRNVAARYNKFISEKRLDGVVVPKEKDWAKCVYYVYTIRCPGRDGLVAHLNKAGIATGIYYPVPVHLQPSVTALFKPSKLEITEKYCKEILSLPMFPGLTDAQISYIADRISEFHRK